MKKERKRATKFKTETITTFVAAGKVKYIRTMPKSKITIKGPCYPLL